MTLPQPPPNPSSILSLLDPAFVSSLNTQSRDFLSTVPYEWGKTQQGGAEYDPWTNTIKFESGSTPSRMIMEHEALHALTLGKGTKGGGIGRFTKGVFYPGSYFNMSKEEKRATEEGYFGDDQNLWEKIKWARQRGVESGPSSWRQSGGIWEDMPQAAQQELGQFFDTIPAVPISDYNISEAMTNPVVESETPFLPGAPKVDQSVLPPSKQPINQRQYNLPQFSAPKAKAKPKASIYTRPKRQYRSRYQAKPKKKRSPYPFIRRH